ncbi:hypothetical protein [Streptomyces cyaneofuscatus]|uniref:hypothetical protein n=1 Tax=Streptomyces cyaneofuscatus TaxID=66883 RepID=UPI00343F9C7E
MRRIKYDWITGSDGHISTAEARRQEASDILGAYYLLGAEYGLGAAVGALHIEANSTFKHNSRPEHVGNVDAIGRRKEVLMVVRERAVGLIEHAWKLISIHVTSCCRIWFDDYLKDTKSDLGGQFDLLKRTWRLSMRNSPPVEVP